MTDLAAVLVAAGRSERMGADKLWIEFWGRPAWRWSLDALLSEPLVSRVALVVPARAVERFRELLPPAATDRCLLVAGGETRSDSVRHGLEALADAGASHGTIVLVHDAARPAASQDLVRSVWRMAVEARAAAPVLAIADTVKIVRDGVLEETVARTSLGAAQTPQAASLGILLAALDGARAGSAEPTDEAAALAAIGVPVRAVPGEAANRKLTEPGDEAILRAVLRERALAGLEATAPASAADRARVGIGFDAHRLVAGTPLRLGGLGFPDQPRGLTGHSDGDAALHAAIDALLGAAHLGDVGALFPPGEAQWSGADSAQLLRRAVEELRGAGLRPSSLDLTIVGAQPAIARVREAMEARIAGIVGLPVDRMSVKGTTSDGLGFGGEEGIAAYAIAIVEPVESSGG